MYSVRTEHANKVIKIAGWDPLSRSPGRVRLGAEEQR